MKLVPLIGIAADADAGRLADARASVSWPTAS